MPESKQKTYEEMKRSINEHSFQVDDSGFKLPDMGQYYDASADSAYMSALDKAIREVRTGDDLKSSFYTEQPYEGLTEFGSYEKEGVLYIKGIPDMSKDAEASGSFDGDTLYFDLKNLKADEKTLKRIQNTYDNSMKALDIHGSVLNSSPRMGLRFLGINAPETPKYSIEEFDLEKEETKRVSRDKLSKESTPDYLYERGASRSEVKFVKIGKQWREYITSSSRNPESGLTQVRVLIKEGESDPTRLAAGLKAKQLVKEIIAKGGGKVYLVLDAVSLERSSAKYPTRYGMTRFDGGAINKLKYIFQQIKDYNRHRYAGYNLWGQDNYGRYLGTPYVQAKGPDGEMRWINISKYLISQVPEIEVFPDYTDSPLAEDNQGFASKIFKLHTYDFEKRMVSDTASAMASIFDSRRKVQQWIFGKNIETLNDWTLTIGDATLFVPPTSIRSITSTTNERMPAMRAKGSITKGAVKSERILEIKLYFNDEKGINGLPYKDTLPNGEAITYYMNGLRALIAQFKFTPFLPVENKYINQVLNIEAVTMKDFQISTMPDYPRCMIGTLVLQEFDYRQYMPELPESVDENGKFRNAFSSTINYDVMRWYYQRSILMGNTLKNVDPGSIEYMEKTFGHRTALQPMKFQDPKVKFMMANEVHLQKMLQVKLGMMRSPNEKIILSEVEKKLARDMSVVYKRVAAALSDRSLSTTLDYVNCKTGTSALGAYKTSLFGINVDDSSAATLSEKSNPFLHMSTKYKNQITADTKDMSWTLENMLNKIKEEVKKANQEIGSDFLYSPRLIVRPSEHDRKGDGVTARKISVGVTFRINSPYVTTDKEIEDLRRDASLTTQGLKEDMFKDRVLFIPFSVRMVTWDGGSSSSVEIMKTEPGSPGLQFDATHPDIQFLAYCSSLAKTLESNGNETMNEEASGLKQASDTESLNTLLYDPYNIGDVSITALSASMTNTMTRFGLNGRDGYAPQYMGGQDVAIEMTLETMSLDSVGMIQAIPRLSAQYARDYRLIIPASPLRIDSEITRLLGVNEVLVETLDITTVPGNPGLFRISMRLNSIDRTLRNREGLQKINEFAIFGKNPDRSESKTDVQTYLKLSAALAQAEVYPDLELPKMEELERTGFEFIRHKLEKQRVYPDPDFYFVYGHILQSQIFRETVTKFTSTEMGSAELTDAHGESYKTKLGMGGYVIESSNEKAKQHQEDYQKIADQGEQGSKAAESHEEAPLTAIDILKTSQDFGRWEISENIKPVFLEKEYRALLNDYERAVKSSLADEADAQGKWVYDALKDTRSASEAIGRYLASTKPKAPASKRTNSFKSRVESAVKSFLEDKQIQSILKLSGTDYSTKAFKNSLTNIMYASSAAATSEKIFTGNRKDPSWMPMEKAFGYTRKAVQDYSSDLPAASIEEAVKESYEVGPYRERMLSRTEIKDLTGKFPERESDGGKGINGSLFFIDPFYQKSGRTIKEIEEHKRNLCTSVEYATVSALRNMMFWMKVMMDDKILPSITHEVMSHQFIDELNASKDKKISSYAQGTPSYQQGKGYGATSPDKGPTGTNIPSKEGSDIQKYIDFLKNSDESSDAGKFFIAAVMSLTNDTSLYKHMMNNDYGKLNTIAQEAMGVSGMRSSESAEMVLFRKFLMALVGTKEIEKETEIGQESTNPIKEYKKALNEIKYIEAAEDPNVYIQHSFFDMVANDKRGRMLRAFPTFYIIFVDEGRDVGMWKLHDNFYNINSIGEINIAKSRKIAADTCQITLSNLFHTFTTEDEDLNQSFEYDYRDVFDSIFNTRAVALREEAKRLKQQPMNRAKLQSGTRVHVRMGYGADASSLPVVFNGAIAEISAGESVEVVAQGDGIELLNPIYDSTQAHKRENEDEISKFIMNLGQYASTPKEILDSFLTKEGGVMKAFMKDVLDGAFYSGNPLGITHFGSRDYKVFYKTGEITQNIYEAMVRPFIGDFETGISERYSMNEAPKFTMNVYGKNFWDILNVCTSVSPDFVSGVVPFGFRSTIFHGAPRYYYAYDYEVREDGIVLEKRKPFQQYHIYTSYTDIIKNDIKASSRDIKTNAQGLYSVDNTVMTDGQKKVGPLWVDWDIYPEFQKSVIYDTQAVLKGIPFVKGIVNKLGKEEGTWTSTDKIAWRMTASLLKDSIKDMYQGEMLIIGDPTVKPHDRFYVHDSYEDISGCALVEGVVHQFSAEAGFVTSIIPDCIAVVDDKHELAIQTGAGQIATASTVAYTALLIGTTAIGGAKTPLVTIASKSAAAMGANIVKQADRIKEALELTETAAKVATTGKKIKLGKSFTMLAGASATLPGALLLFALEMGATYLIGHTVTEAIERKMKEKQVLQIFPLKKNQEVLTSGLSGHAGLVFGSPTYNIQGTYDKLYAMLDTDTNGLNGMINGMINFFLPEAIKAQGRKYSNIANRGYSDSVHAEADYSRLLKSLASDEGRSQTAYQRMLLVPRIDPDNKETIDKDMEKLFKEHAFLDTNVIELQPEISSRNTYIYNDKEVISLIKGGRLKTIWDMALADGDYVSKEMLVNGERKTVRALKVDRSGKEILDIPFLKADALEVLKVIAEKAEALRPSGNTAESILKAIREDFIMIQSCLKVGDDKTISSTGYSFVLEALGKDKDKILKVASDEALAEFESLTVDKSKKTKVFKVDLSPDNPAQIVVTVYPPA